MARFSIRGGEGLPLHPVTAALERLDVATLGDPLVIDCRGMQLGDAAATAVGDDGRPVLLLGSTAAHRQLLLPHVPVRSRSDAPAMLVRNDGGRWSIRELAPEVSIRTEAAARPAADAQTAAEEAAATIAGPYREVFIGFLDSMASDAAARAAMSAGDDYPEYLKHISVTHITHHPVDGANEGTSLTLGRTVRAFLHETDRKGDEYQVIVTENQVTFRPGQLAANQWTDRGFYSASGSLMVVTRDHQTPVLASIPRTSDSSISDSMEVDIQYYDKTVVPVLKTYTYRRRISEAATSWRVSNNTSAVQETVGWTWAMASPYDGDQWPPDWGKAKTKGGYIQELPTLCIGSATFNAAGASKTWNVLRGWITMEFILDYALHRISCTEVGWWCFNQKFSSRGGQAFSHTQIDLSKVVPDEG